MEIIAFTLLAALQILGGVAIVLAFFFLFGTLYALVKPWASDLLNRWDDWCQERIDR